MSQELANQISAEVSRAEQDYQTVRTRSLNLIAVGGGLVALVSGLLAIAAGGGKGQIVDTAAKVSLGVGLACFVLSTLLGLLVNVPGWVTATDVDDLQDKVQDEWNADGADQMVAEVQVKYLRSLRANNKTTARQLIWSIGFQAAGITGIALAAMLVLANMSSNTPTMPRQPCSSYRSAPSCGPMFGHHQGPGFAPTLR